MELALAPCPGRSRPPPVAFHTFLVNPPRKPCQCQEAAPVTCVGGDAPLGVLVGPAGSARRPGPAAPGPPSSEAWCEAEVEAWVSQP